MKRGLQQLSILAMLLVSPLFFVLDAQVSATTYPSCNGIGSIDWETVAATLSGGGTFSNPILGTVTVSGTAGSAIVKGTGNNSGTYLEFANQNHTLTLSWTNPITSMVLPIADMDFGESVTLIASGASFSPVSLEATDTWTAPNTLSGLGNNLNSDPTNYSTIRVDAANGITSIQLVFANIGISGQNALLDVCILSNTTPSPSTFAFNCGTASVTGTFIANSNLGQNGSLTLPLSSATAGSTTLNVSGSGFSGSITTILTAGQTSVNIPITYDGSGTGGSRTLTVTSTGASGACTPSVTVNAGTPPDNYLLLTDLNNSNGTNPLVATITNAGCPAPATAGNFTSLTIPSTTCGTAITRQGWHINRYAGLSYSNSGGLVGNSYTISIFARFNLDAAGYNRVIDFSNGTADAGIYISGTSLNFYPNGNVGTLNYFNNTNYYYLTFTRDAATSIITVYVNGTLFTTYNDAAGTYKPYTTNGPVRLFVDNNLSTPAPCEATSGDIVSASFSGYYSSAAAVTAAFNNICSNVQPPASFTFNCGTSGSSSNFFAGAATNQTGTIAVPITGVVSGKAYFSVSGGGFTATDTVILTSGQTSVNLPVKYDGSGAIGSHSVTVSSSAGIGSCTFNVNVIGGTDSDGDGIPDAYDIDDDNDGIPDYLEQACPKLATMTNWTAITTQKSATGTLALASGNVTVTYTSPQVYSIQGQYWYGNGDGYNGSIPTAGINGLQSLNGVNTTHTYSFSAPVTNPILYFWSDNGNTYTFNAPFIVPGTPTAGHTILSSNSFSATSEGSIAVQFIGTYSSISYTSSILENWTEVTVGVQECTDKDTDGDGIADRFDLDSDGDGCSDAFEAGATKIKTANYKFTSSVGSNGLADALEKVADNTNLNYTPTVNYATNALQVVCTDTDGDGVPDFLDLDNDNDGIPDVVECPPVGDVNGIASGSVTLTGYMPNRKTNPTPTNSLTAVGSWGWPSSGVNYNTSYINTAENNEYELVISKKLSSVLAGATVSISATISTTTGTASGDTISFEINGISIYKDRYPATLPVTLTFTGITATANPTVALVIHHGINNPGNNDPYIPLFGYSASTFCDTDGDGIENRFDLDSDGDGCSDAYEGGATNSKIANFKFTGAVGTNGLPDAVETVADNGVVNYRSSYANFALNSAKSKCNLPNPGGVGSSLAWWFEGDAGVTTSGTTVTTWADQSPSALDVTQTTVSRQPKNTNLQNFNPVMTFNGSNALNNATGFWQTSTGNTAYNVFAVAKHTNGTGSVNALFSENTSQGFQTLFYDYGGNSYNGIWASNYAYTPYAPFSAVPQLVSSRYNNIGNVKQLYYNAKAATMTAAGAATPFNGNSSNLVLGNYVDQASWPLNGDIAEIVMYAADLNTTQRQQVESYLAIKWGITLDQTTAYNYLNSVGSIVWNATANNGFNNDIAGIGRDNAAGLNQKQSQSINAGYQPIIALNTAALSNAANANTFSADSSFDIIGSNGASSIFNTTYTPTTFTTAAGFYRMSKVWKVQETGTVGTITIKVPSGSAERLLVSSTATFGAGTQEIPLVANGVGFVSAQVDLTNGQYFTFGRVATGPGGIVTAIVPCNLITNGDFATSTLAGWTNSGSWTNNGPAAYINADNVTNRVLSQTLTGLNTTTTPNQVKLTFDIWAAWIGVASTLDISLGGTKFATYTISSGSSITGVAANGATLSVTSLTNSVFATGVTLTIPWSSSQPNSADLAFTFNSGNSDFQLDNLSISSNNCAKTLGWWFKGDAGITKTGAGVSTWQDQSLSALDVSQATATSQPTVANYQNFNPVVTFTGNNALNSPTSYWRNSVSNASYNVFAVAKHTTGTGSVNALFMENTTPADQTLLYEYGGNAYTGFYGGNYAYTPFPASISAVPQLLSSRYNVSGNVKQLYFNSKVQTMTSSGAAVPFSGVATSNFVIGNHYNQSSWPYVGDIAEMCMYPTDLTTIQRQQVESYLAIKWGITLDQTTAYNYLNSNGDTIWNATTNSGYKNNIAGIGRDDAAGLDQRQSQSINAGSWQPVIANLNIAATNQANTNSFSANKSFEVWGSDAGATNFGTAYIFNGMTQRITRIWKVQETGTVGKVKVAFLKSDLGGVANPNLLVSGSATFDGSATQIPMIKEVLGGLSYYTAVVDFTNGQFFSVGAYITAPGGVATNLAWWFEGDAGVTTSPSNGAVTQWNDQTLGALHVSQATTTKQPAINNELNFNKVVTFNGANSLSNIAGYWKASTNNPAFNVFAVAKHINGTSSVNELFSENTNLGPQSQFYEYGGNVYTGLWSSNYAYTPFTPAMNAVPQLITSRYNNTGSVKQTYFNSKSQTMTSGGAVPTFNGANGNLVLGSWIDQGSYPFNGDIAEIVMYAKDLTATQRQQVESYLALKWGITLDQTTAYDYLNTAGTKVWDATANSGYKNNIAGIGRDDVDGLDQRQSQSINSGFQPVIGNVAIAVDNDNNTNAFATNNNYLVWGDNGASVKGIGTGISTALTTAGINSWMSRKYKVTETGTVGNVLIRIPIGSGAGFDPTLPIKLLVADDAGFTTNTAVVTMNKVSTNFEGSYDFNGAKFFTFGQILPDTDGDGIADLYDIDCDNDGILDVIENSIRIVQITEGGGASTSPPSTVTSYNLNGLGAFTTNPQITTVATPQGGFGTDNTQATLTGDLNNDGISDLLFVYEGTNIVSTYLGMKDGTFMSSGTNSTIIQGIGGFGTDGSQATQLADVTGDGILDLTFIETNTHILNVWTGNGDGTFNANPITSTLTQQAGGFGTDAARQTWLTDMTGDGIPDLLYIYEGNNIANVWKNNGNGTFPAAPIQSYLTPVAGGFGTDGVSSNMLKDVTGDGIADMIYVYEANNIVYVWPGSSSGTFQTTPLSSTVTGVAGGFGTDGAQQTDLYDFNGDGALDLFYIYNGNISVWAGNGIGGFASTPITTPLANAPTFGTDGSKAFFVMNGSQDYDGDGIANRLDLDSDNDGCSDAFEGSATLNKTANYTFTGPYGANGLANSLETAVDNGIVNYVPTYANFALNENNSRCNITAPGGVIQGLSMWLKADAGVSAADGAAVTQWKDQSGIGYNVAQPGSTTAKFPVYRATGGKIQNYNPVLEFTGSNFLFNDNPILPSNASPYTYGWMAVDTNAGGGFKAMISAESAINNFVVYKSDYSLGASGYGGIVPYGIYGVPDPGYWGKATTYGPYENAFFKSGTASNNLTYTVRDPSTTRSQPQIFGMASNGAKLDPFYAWTDGFKDNPSWSFANESGPSPYAHQSFAVGVTYNKSAGASYANNFLGTIGEAYAYNRQLTDVEMQKINSYMAIKWGVTMGQGNGVVGRDSAVNYIASDGTVLWNATTNKGNAYNIGAIGLDSASALIQKQSQSAQTYNNGNIVSIGLGLLASNNKTNNASFAADKSFEAWGDNGLDISYAKAYTTNSFTPPAQFYRMNRTWKVQETGTVGSVTISVPASTVVNAERLLVANDSLFGAGTQEIALTADGSGNLTASIDFTNGQYFTLGRSLVAPGGVTAGLNLWLKADALSGTDGSKVSSWKDSYLSNYTVTQATASQQPTLYTTTASNLVNYNPTVKFNNAVGSLLNNATASPLGAGQISYHFIVSAKDIEPSAAGPNYGSGRIRGMIGNGSSGNNPAFDLQKDGASFNGWNPYSDLTGEWFGGKATIYNGGGIGTSNGTGTLVIPPANSTRLLNQQPQIFALGFTAGTTTHINSTVDGWTETTTLVDNNAAYTAAANFRIGDSGSGEWWNGFTNEVIAYNREISALELQKVNTYLAIKFGVTLGQGNNVIGRDSAYDYIATDGTTKLWNVSTNNGFNYDIGVIGRDDAEALNQKQSTSVNAGLQPIIALGSSIAFTNQSNSNTFAADKNFEGWGSNGLNSGYNVVYTPTTFTPVATFKRMNRVWKVQETGTVGTVTVNANTNADYMLVQSGGTGNFVGGTITEVPLVNNQASYDFANGDFFTFGKDINPNVCNNGVAFIHGDDVASSSNSSTVGLSAWVSNGNGTFRVSPKIAQTGFITTGSGTFGDDGASQTFSSDVNNDGLKDIVHVTEENSNSIYVYLNNGNNTFSTQPLVTTGITRNPEGSTFTGISGAEQGWMGDTNNDGYPDYIQSGNDNKIYVWLNNGDGTFSKTWIVTTLTSFSGYQTSGISSAEYFQIADVNNDGSVDLVGGFVAGATSAHLTVWFGNGDGTFQSQPYFDSDIQSSGSSHSVGAAGSQFSQFADVDGDGDLDYVHAEGFDATPQIWAFLNNGDGTFQTTAVLSQATVTPKGNSVADFANYTTASISQFIDVNSDGKADYVVTIDNGTPAQNGIYTYLATSNGYFATTPIFTNIPTQFASGISANESSFLACGFIVCNAGVKKPLLAATTAANTCPTLTVNLSTITASNQPNGTVITWHIATPATLANRVADSTKITASGTYYAAFYDKVNDCFSGNGDSTSKVVVTITNPCPATFTFNCGSTVIVGTFTSNAVTGQTGSISIPITGTTPGGATFNVAGAGFIGTLTTTLTAGQTSVIVPLTFDGSGVAGTRTLTITCTGGTGTCTATATVVPKPLPILAITKTGPSTLNVGQNANYTISVANSGNAATSANIIVKDTLQLDLAYVSVSGTGWAATSATIGTGQVVVTATYSGVGIAPSANSILTLTVVPKFSGSYTNIASVSGGGDTAMVPKFSAPTSPLTVTGPTYTVTKTASATPIQINTNYNYVIKVTNTGTGASSGNVTVTDTLQLGLAYVNTLGANWSTTTATIGSGQTVVTSTYTGILNVNGFSNDTLVVSATTPGSYTNSATASGGGTKSSTTSATTLPKTINGIPVLAITRNVPATASVGNPITLMDTVKNIGTGPTTGNIIVTDTVPIGFTYVGTTGTGWSATTSTLPDGRTLITSTYTGSPIAGGANSVLTNIVTPTVAGTYPATAGAAVTGGGDAMAPKTAAATNAIVVSGPIYAITKTVSTTSVPVGQNFDYTIVVTNTGSVASYGSIIVKDTLPLGTTYVSTTGTSWASTTASISGGQTVVTSTYSGTALAVNGISTLKITVNAASVSTGTNRATVVGGGITTPTTSSSTPVTNIVAAAPSLSMTKVGPTSINVGVNFNYTFTVTNSGTAPSSTTITIKDTLNLALVYVSTSGTGWNANTTVLGDGRTVVTLNFGGSIPINSSSTALLTVYAKNNSNITNTAVVSSPEDPATPKYVPATAPTSVNGPALILSKTAGSTTVITGNNYNYSFVVANYGSAPTYGAFTVKDTLQTGLQFVSGTGANWVFTTTTISSGQTVVTANNSTDVLGFNGNSAFLMTVKATTAGSYTNTATLSGGGSTNTLTTPPTSATLVNGNPILAIAKTGPSTATGVGQNFDYQIAVTNTGTGVTTDSLVVLDTLQTGLSYVSTSGTGWTSTTSTFGARTIVKSVYKGTALNYTTGGTSTTLTLTVSAASPGSYTNTATVSGGGDLTGSKTSTPTSPLTVSGPTFIIAKSSTATAATVGTGFDYNILVFNSSVYPSSGNIVVMDTLQTGLAYVATSGTGWVSTTATIGTGQTVVTSTYTGAVLVPNGSTTLNLTVKATAAGSYTNKATVMGGGSTTPLTSPSTSPIPASNATPTLSVTKTGVASANVGQNFNYTIVVSNSGTSSTTANVVIADTLQSGLAYVSTGGTGWASTTSILASGQTVVTSTYTGTPIVINGSSTLTLSVKALIDGTYTNKVTMSGGGDGTNPKTTPSTSPTTLMGPTYSIAKSSTTTSIVTNQNFDYDIVVTNTSSITTVGSIVVLDTLQTGLAYIATSGTGWASTTATIGSGQVVVTSTYTGPNLAASATANLTLTVKATATGNYTNAASVVGGGTNTSTKSSTTTPIAASGTPKLNLVKTGTALSSVGTNFDYTLTVTNTGDGATTAMVTIADTLQAGLSYVGVSGTGWTASTATFNGRTIVNASYFGTAIPAGGSSVLTLTVLANVGGNYTNVATLNGGGDPSLPKTSNTTTPAVIAAPKYSIAKSASTSSITVGNNYVYNIFVINTGTVPTYGAVTVCDTLQLGLNYVSVSNGWTATTSSLPDGRTVVKANYAAAIPSAQSVSLALTVVPTVVASFTNVASVTGGGNTSMTPSAVTSPTISTPSSAVLTITKSGVASAIVGTNFDFTITVGNAGTGATSGNVIVVDTLLLDMKYVSVSGAGWTATKSVLADGREVVSATYTGGAITVGSTSALTLTVYTIKGGNFNNTAFVRGGGDVTGAKKSNTTTTVVVIGPTYTIVKSVSSTLDSIGKPFSYSVFVVNTGSVTTFGNVIIRDTLQSGLQYISTSSIDWVTSSSTLTDGRTLLISTNATNPLSHGENSSLTYNVMALKAGSYTNIAVVDSGGAALPATSLPTAPTIIHGLPVLTVVKVNPTNAVAGVPTTIIDTVKNIGNDTTKGVITIIDTLPKNLKYLSTTGTGWTSTPTVLPDGRTVVVTKTSNLIPNGGASPFTLNVLPTVAGSYPPSGTNISGGGDPKTPTNVSPTGPTLVVTGVPNIQISKSVNPNPPVAGTNMVLTDSVKNVGTGSTIGTLTVVDTLPVGAQYISTAGPNWTSTTATLPDGRTVVTSTSSSTIQPDSTSKLAITVKPTVAGPFKVSDSNVSGGGDTLAPKNIPSNLTFNVSNAAGVSIAPRVFLGGNYNAITGLMNDTLRRKSLIPLTQPYNTLSDFAYTGNETTSLSVLSVSNNNAIVDWVLLELRDATTPTTVIAKKAALLTRAGDIVSAADGVSSPRFDGIADGNYYVVVRHRNHLGVMTATPQPLSSNISLVVDFTKPTTANYQLTGVKASPYAQDSINGKRMLWLGKTTTKKQVAFSGANNSLDPVLVKVTTDPSNQNSIVSAILSGLYNVEDTNLDGKTIFQGGNNEVDLIFTKVSLFQANTNSASNYIIIEQVPQ